LGGEFEDFEVGRVVGPIVAPEDDDVTAIHWVAVVAEVAAFKLKFDVDALPAILSDLPLGLAVRESRLNGLNDVAEFFGNEAKEEHNALFVDGFVAEAAEIEGAAVHGPVFERRVMDLTLCRRVDKLLIGHVDFVCRRDGRGAEAGLM